MVFRGEGRVFFGFGVPSLAQGFVGQVGGNMGFWSLLRLRALAGGGCSGILVVWCFGCMVGQVG